MNNLFLCKDNIVFTPVPNGTFLNGITRRRIIQLLSSDGYQVVEKTVTYKEVAEADEIFATGNFAKVIPCVKLENRTFSPGPIFQRARYLYFQYARDTSKKAA